MAGSGSSENTGRATQAARQAERFAAALLAGDHLGAARCFAPEGMCLSRDGTEVRGRGPVAALLGQITDSEHRLAIHLGRTLVDGDVALATQFWTRRSRPSGSEAFEAPSTARLVLGRCEKRWEILIASPWE
ncbi:MAG TPA: hypothetical protein VHZ54_10480 [Solirubrobacterales bacterium]|jgi:ketosteroid isomerase-like protein|nr:hypothetical protein [Solirubrobacterales bacterium]